MLLGIDLTKYKKVKAITTWIKVLLFPLQKDTGIGRKIFRLIQSKNLKADGQKERK